MAHWPTIQCPICRKEVVPIASSEPNATIDYYFSCRHCGLDFHLSANKNAYDIAYKHKGD